MRRLLFTAFVFWPNRPTELICQCLQTALPPLTGNDTSLALFARVFDELLQLVASFCDVLPHLRCGYFRILGLTRIEEFAMCLAGTMQVARTDQMQTSVAIGFEVQRFQK
jgi:hypothetical protein